MHSIDHITREKPYTVAICGVKNFATCYLWSLQYYASGYWKQNPFYNWCEECLEGIPDLEYINNTEL